MICCGEGVVCDIRSQNAHDFFSWDGDGRGKERGKLVNSIIRGLCHQKRNKEKCDAKWEAVWSDPICMRYKRKEHDDYWLWNHEFYRAEIGDLLHICELVKKG